MVRLPVPLNRLEQDQGIAAPVPQLVLPEVRCNRVDPGRELLRLVEAMQVPEDTDEYLLHQVLRPLAIPDRPIDEVEKSGLIPVDHCTECLWVTSQVTVHQLTVVELMERLARYSAWAVKRRRFALEDCPHVDSSV